ncbi:MAG: FAD-binding oxidoreductase [Planctomycetota bacterium]
MAGTQPEDRRARLAAALRERLEGEVIAEGPTLERCAVDQSIYRIPPLVVVHPRCRADIVETLAAAGAEGVPVTARGGGSGTAGAALGAGVVLAFRRGGPLGRISQLRRGGEAPCISAGPAAVHDDVQAALRRHGLFLPADPSSGKISLIGGNVATKASGPHALKHGSIDRYLVDAEFVTAAGEIVDTADETTIPDRIRDGVLELKRDLLADEEAAALLRSREGMKIASGYNLFAFLRHERPGPLLTALLAGSVGTLGVLTRATLRAEARPEGRATTLVFFRSLEEAGRAARLIAAEQVAAVEMMNHRTVAMVRAHHPGLPVPEGEAHVLLVEYAGPGRHEQIDRVEGLLRGEGFRLTSPARTVETEEEQAEVWRIRKALFPIVRTHRRDRRALSVVNDVGVPVDRLAPFIQEVEAVFDEFDLEAPIYGHAGSGNLHLRPLFDPADPRLEDTIQRVADRIYDVVFRHGGTVTAEHGMGPLRAPYLPEEWGDRVIDYMRRMKDLLDPDGILNPGAMFSERPITDNLKPL